jgi:hypothetical protein
MNYVLSAWDTHGAVILHFDALSGTGVRRQIIFPSRGVAIYVRSTFQY